MSLKTAHKVFKKIKKQTQYEVSEHHNITESRRQWGTSLAVLRGIFMALNVCIRKQEHFTIKKSNFPTEEAIKKEQNKPNVHRRKKMINIWEN